MIDRKRHVQAARTKMGGQCRCRNIVLILMLCLAVLTCLRCGKVAVLLEFTGMGNLRGTAGVSTFIIDQTKWLAPCAKCGQIHVYDVQTGRLEKL